jgi:hypothetical protein
LPNALLYTTHGSAFWEIPYWAKNRFSNYFSKVAGYELDDQGLILKHIKDQRTFKFTGTGSKAAGV